MDEVIRYELVNIAIGLVFYFGYSKRKYKWIMHLGSAFIVPALYEMALYAFLNRGFEVSKLAIVGDVLFYGFIALTVFTFFKEFGKYREKLSEKEQQRKKKQ
ncbi:hypothetical protein PRVXH_001162 [Proteinivorax hydrogeniformans]|uniref:Uncharacterized protein n=1 Tax=Proteinivorax hydrogeniformans TaxID=1826727 RepID=A0AAU8HWR3_9FIRM